jgi:transcriptional regulator with XRE-family HTH domain
MEYQRELSLVETQGATKEGRNRLLTERAIVRVTKQLEEAMEARGVSRSELATMLGRSKGWVTQLLDGENNKTIRTIAYVFAVLGARFDTGFTFLADTDAHTRADRISVAFDICDLDVWRTSESLKWSGAPTIEGPPQLARLFLK